MNEFMKVAVDEAKIAYDEGNVPVGAVIVKDNVIIAASHNKKNTSNISVYHAEILCIIETCKKLGSWYLDDCVMYVTLKPCDMCTAAIAESRIKNIFYLLESNYSSNLNKNISKVKYKKIDLDNEYSLLVSNFFKNLRIF